MKVSPVFRSNGTADEVLDRAVEIFRDEDERREFDAYWFAPVPGCPTRPPTPRDWWKSCFACARWELCGHGFREAMEAVDRSIGGY